MSPHARPRLRSALYVPASNPRAIEKARGLHCDAVILDLEDAVSPTEKARARTAAVEVLTQGALAGRQVAVRINGLDTPWGLDDLDAVCVAQPDAILIPKVSKALDLHSVADRAADPSIQLWAMIETCTGVLRLGEIAAAPRLAALVFGANDLLAEMGAGAAPDRRALWPALSMTVMAARAHGLLALDGVYNAIADPDGLEAECEQGSSFGFDGKTLVHPSQIDACHRAFAPTEEELAYARAVVAAFALPEHREAGVISVGGRMTERLHLAQSLRLLAIHDDAREP